MPLGILDIGSNTVQLLVVEPAPHISPTPRLQQRRVVPIMRHLDEREAITAEGISLLRAAVDEALIFARSHKVEQLIGIATSALHEVTNGAAILEELGERAGTPLRVLTGTQEAEFTFLAARRWVGWSANRLLLADIGGSSLQLAQGTGEIPEQAFSLPLGSGRLTHQFLSSDPAPPTELAELRAHVRSVLGHLGTTLTSHRPHRVVGTSKILRTLGRVAGEPHTHRESRIIHVDELEHWSDRLSRTPAARRLELPGITPERAHHIVAGSIVAVETMRAMGVTVFETCPWALREGLLLQFIDPLGTSPLGPDSSESDPD